MSKSDLDEAYERVLADSRARGEVAGEAPQTERRGNPRIRVNPGDLAVEIDPWVFAIDISISGMAFYSDTPVERGEAIHIALTDDFAVEARVVDSHLETSDSPVLPSRYRLHCEFDDEERGKELLVRIKEMEHRTDSSMND